MQSMVALMVGRACLAPGREASGKQRLKSALHALRRGYFSASLGPIPASANCGGCVLQQKSAPGNPPALHQIIYLPFVKMFTKGTTIEALASSRCF